MLEDVSAIATTNPRKPTGETSLVKLRNGDAYWLGEKLDSGNVTIPSVHGTTYPFRGKTLEVVVRLTHVTFDTETKVLSGI